MQSSFNRGSRPVRAALLEATLKEEKATDAALTTLAKSVVNVEAEQDL